MLYSYCRVYSTEPYLYPETNDLLIEIFHTIVGRMEIRMDYSYTNEELPDIEGIDRAYAKLHFADNETLKDCLLKFYLSLEQDSDLLDSLSVSVADGKAEDLPTFRNRAHSTKSSAAILGMVQIAGLAKTAEDAAKCNDIEVIRVITPLLTREMRKMKTRLEVLCPPDAENLQHNVDLLELAVKDIRLDEGTALIQTLKEILLAM